MTEQPTALRLADALDRYNAGVCSQAIYEDYSKAAAELRRLHEAHDWQYKMAGERLRRIENLEAQRDALLGLLRAELPHAEWQDKIIHPYRGESWQNWKISIWLPVPVSASDRSPEAALTRAVDAAIKAAEGEQK